MSQISYKSATKVLCRLHLRAVLKHPPGKGGRRVGAVGSEVLFVLH